MVIVPIAIGMPNHVHALISFKATEQSINTIVGNGKRFMAYEIVKRLQAQGEKDLLLTLQNNVEAKRRANNKLHDVWKLSFDWKYCNSLAFPLVNGIYVAVRLNTFIVQQNITPLPRFMSALTNCPVSCPHETLMYPFN